MPEKAKIPVVIISPTFPNETGYGNCTIACPDEGGLHELKKFIKTHCDMEPKGADPASGRIEHGDEIKTEVYNSSLFLALRKTDLVDTKLARNVHEAKLWLEQISLEKAGIKQNTSGIKIG